MPGPVDFGGLAERRVLAEEAAAAGRVALALACSGCSSRASRPTESVEPADERCEHTFVSEGPSILHADADAFFASVEQRDDPRLRGRPTIVGAGVVMAASYEARAHGIHGGMSGWRARRLCPEAVVVPPRFDAYVEASRGAFRSIRRDRTACRGPLAGGGVHGRARAGGDLRDPAADRRAAAARARERVGLALSVGVARTKVLAKMASRAAKPDGLLVIEAGSGGGLSEAPSGRGPVGGRPVTADKLRAHGVGTIGELERRDEWELALFLGAHAARHLHAIAQRRDPRRVRRGPPRRSIGTQSAFAGGGRSGSDLDALLVSAGRPGHATGASSQSCRPHRDASLSLR